MLCVFIMGTWVGSSFPYYHLSRHIPNLCNRVHDLETSTRITQPPPPPPPMTPSSATAKQANRHPNDHYAVTYEHTTTFPTTQPSSQSTSPSYTSKDDDHLVEVETQFPVETMRPTSTSDTSVPKIGSTVDSPTTNSYSNVPVSEDGSQSQTTVGHQWSTSSSNSSEGSAHNISKVSSKYLVDTSTCKIPKFNPRDPSLKNIINQVEPLDCGRPPLTYVEENVLFIHEKASVQYYGARNLSDVSCCYKVVKRKNVGQGSDDNYM